MYTTHSNMFRTTFVVVCAFLVCASVVMAVDISRTQRRTHSQMSLEATTTATTSTKYSLPNHRYVLCCVVCILGVYNLYCL
jgi:ribosomal protein L32